MRSFEFVEGTSAKFWEIRREGGEVTVRFGRVGTAGQTKVKTFEEPGLAQVHEDKLIAEKLKKGYAESTAPTAAAAAPASSPAPASPAPAPAAAPRAPITTPAPPAPAAVPPPDEDTFVFPAAWYRHRYARRGSAGPVTFTPGPTAREKADKEIKRVPNQVTTLLESSGTDRSLRVPALAWRAGDPSAPPVGAAAVLVAAALGAWYDGPEMTAFADTWVAERGVPFAAEAAVHVMGMRVTEDGVRSERGPHYCVQVMGPGDSRHGYRIDQFAQVLFRVRQALAAASDADYAATVTMLAGHRERSRYHRVATSVLAPGRTAWVEQDIAEVIAAQDRYLCAVLLAAAGTGEQAAALAKEATTYAVAGSMPLLATLADGAGPACAPALFEWFDQDGSADARRRLLSMLAPLPGDEVMAGLIERIDTKYVVPALLEAAERFPARALRLLAGAAGTSRTAADLLRGHVAGHPGLAGRVLPALSPAAAARVTEIADAGAAVVIAPAEALPPLLAAPPWLHRVKTAKPVVIAGLACDDAPSMRWLPGERETWRETRYTREQDPTHGWEQLARRLRTNQHRWNEPALFFLEAPEDLARGVLRTWKPRNVWEVEAWMRVVVARFETDALDACLSLATDSAQAPAETVPLLMPFASPRLAVLMADWLARLKSVRREAQAWMLRHPAEAARALVPAALQKPGAPRRQAERALLALHGNGHGDAVRAAAESYGAEAATAIGTLLAIDPLQVLPAKIPANPGWAVPGLLPPLTLRGGAGALPAEAAANVVTVLALSRADDPYPGVEIVKEACHPGSLAEFGWQLFQRWQGSGANPKENWVLDALALVGDDETVRRLTPLILAWPGEGGHAKAVTGVDVLAAVGTDVALMHLYGIAQRARFKGLKSAAQQKMDEVAAGLGLSAEQLADRLVPDFGLEPDGSMRLDYGPRQFVVGFDEQLRPYVTDAAGKHLKALPKPGARDDDELAPAAFTRFGGLKKDVRTIATDQIRRLEQAMVTGRRWTGAEFRELFVGHPLLWHIVRRLVWGVHDSSGALVGAIRVAEDRSFSTVDDDETTIADDTLVGVVHPLHLGAALAGWAEVFADYEILQPFPQLSRATFTLGPEEAAGSSLARFEKLTLPTTRLLGLERRGWRRDEPLDGGVQAHIVKVVGPGLEMAVGLDPGIVVGMVTEFPEQTLTSVFLHDGSSTGWSRDDGGRVPLGRLGPAVASEIVRDLTEISAA